MIQRAVLGEKDISLSFPFNADGLTAWSLAAVMRFFQRLRQHQHPWSAAIRTIIHRTVIILGKVTRIPGMQPINRVFASPGRLRHAW